MQKRPRPLSLIILDGWGYREAENDNAIATATKPYWDALWKKYPHTLISGSGRCVGLPHDQMGNSEVGHLNMGAGRVVNQDLTQIDADIESGIFFSNPVLTQAIENAVTHNKALHVLGLVSPGGVHSHENHLLALIQMAAQHKLKKLYIHAFLDGRDTPPRSAADSLAKLEAYCKQVNCGEIISLIGRYYAMDRDKRWDRIEQAYNLLTSGLADYEAPDVLTGLELAYARGENDEFVSATRIQAISTNPITMEDGDSLIFMNFRADRARELTHAFIDTDFNSFERPIRPKLAHYVTLSEYDKNFPVAIAYPPKQLTNILGAYLSELGLHQLRIAETEKYAHVTFFFNGGVEQAYPLEDRILIPSPKVSTYDLKPEMSAPELCDRLVSEIQSQQYDVIVCNFANPDMVGHTGNFAATVSAIETIDACLAKIIPALLAVGGEALITADHGNAELMYDHTTQQAHTAHTMELVPFIYIGRPAKISKTHGVLSDIAPTMLYLMGLTKPQEMTGTSLVELT